MDAKKIFGMIKPHLDHLDHSERNSLSKLIISQRPEKITCQHRKVRPLSKAKEHLKTICQKEMERERNGRPGL